MIRADHARRTLRLHAERLAQTATDPAGPDPAAATLTQADALGRVLDGLAGQFAPHPGSLPRTTHTGDAPRQAGEEDLDEERLLLATATAYPAEVQQMRWLAAEDFLLPLHAALWQSVTALVHRGDMVDPVTVLGEAQHRGLITDALPPPRDLMALVSTPAGSPEYWGERVLQRTLLARCPSAGTPRHGPPGRSAQPAEPHPRARPPMTSTTGPGGNVHRARLTSGGESTSR
ncbi:DnaB-like helicase N-terminal domain-containing protein [Streptomyces sp. NPDC058665]|uniref:DnaB-like helicase N-terminal domain-containing protein n=1 Tax=Streptomyces sp. NPDC058665 TaxID=3346586 RepID=UPI0036578D1C